MKERKIITFGTFDMFHIGHLRILERARSFGHFLVVGVSSDDLNQRKKGFEPLFSQDERVTIVKSLRCVDEVFIEESMELKRQYIVEHRASMLVMGSDWAGKFDEFRDICDVMYLERTPDISSTLIKERIRHPL
jgi:glycerol-3-phosphate cytidylyltransferase